MTIKLRFLQMLIALMLAFISLSPTVLKNTSSQAQSGDGAKLQIALSVNKFTGLCYGPYRDNENPNYGVQPTATELSEDIAFVRNLTNSIRTYGVTDNLELIPVLCQQYGIDCYPGAWLSIYECENDRQIQNLIQIANQNLSHVKGLIVGNEVLLRKDISKQKLIEFISLVKNSTGLPVGSAEIWTDWNNNPDLAEAVDILFVHIYPYWDGIAVEEAANYISQKWNELKTAYPTKTMVIGETGWPSAGETRGNAIPSEENQKKFLSDFVHLADSSHINYFYFEVFDEMWKSISEGQVGGHWGLYNSNGSPKPLLRDLIPEEAQDGITRSPREIDTVQVPFPHYVYHDGCDPQNSFYPSGWMGELASFGRNDSTLRDPTQILDESSSDDPFSGETCIRISYTPSVGQWGGIYWQFPVNNWGTYPGYDLSESITQNDTVKLKFRVRGKYGGEKAEFKTGGIFAPTLQYRDSYGPVSAGVITLKKEWQEHSISLTGRNLSMVIGGFAWVTNYNQNPQGATIYLDEIIFEVTSPVGVREKEDITPKAFSLDQNYPNPFNPVTTIKYGLPYSSNVKLRIYDVLGQIVATLADEEQYKGYKSIEWNASNIASGVYFYRLEATSVSDPRKIFTHVKKMLILM